MFFLFIPQTIQIMIGVVVLMFGVVTAIHVVTLSAYVRIMFWGGAMVRLVT